MAFAPSIISSVRSTTTACRHGVSGKTPRLHHCGFWPRRNDTEPSRPSVQAAPTSRGTASSGRGFHSSSMHPSGGQEGLHHQVPHCRCLLGLSERSRGRRQVTASSFRHTPTLWWTTNVFLTATYGVYASSSTSTCLAVKWVSCGYLRHL